MIRCLRQREASQTPPPQQRYCRRCWTWRLVLFWSTLAALFVWQNYRLVGRHRDVFVGPDPDPPSSLPPVVGIFPRRGAVVLGMHRSGTSLLTGALATLAGYTTGHPLLGPSSDNPKGVFELALLVAQNDRWMLQQRLTCMSHNLTKYRPPKLSPSPALNQTAPLASRALAFWNHPNHTQIPYIIKDPRLCITLPTWLSLLEGHEPAIVFIYRHPLHVARSLHKRHPGPFVILRGLQLWLLYNHRALHYSHHLCRVTVSHHALMARPVEELERLVRRLTDYCHVPPPPVLASSLSTNTATSQSFLTPQDVKNFVDPTLVHHHHSNPSSSSPRSLQNKVEVLKDFGGGCQAYDYESSFSEGSTWFQLERAMYLHAMQVYCDLESGKAYQPSYIWPPQMVMQK